MGLAINTLKPPFKRRALRERCRPPEPAADDREAVLQRVPADQLDYAGTPYENRTTKNEYEPALAVKLLGEAAGRIATRRPPAKNGQPLAMELLLLLPSRMKAADHLSGRAPEGRHRLNSASSRPRRSTRSCISGMFELAMVIYGGWSFRTPETSVASSLADQNNNTTLRPSRTSGVDELLGQVRQGIRPEEEAHRDHPRDRSIVANSHEYVLFWEPSYHAVRVLEQSSGCRRVFTSPASGDYRDVPGPGGSTREGTRR